METIALLLSGAGLVCMVLCIRDVGALLFAAAIGFWLLPFIQSDDVTLAGFATREQPQPAPTAEFRTAVGKSLSLDDFRGRVVLLNLWTASCVPCQSEMPSLDRLQAMYQGDGLAVLAVSVDNAGGNAVRRFFQRTGIRNLTPYLDDAGSTGIAFTVHRLPTTLLIDRDGKVVGSLTAAAEWDSPDALALIRRYLDS
jgi:thiol-disulfide isomerase/thioredoxin